MADGSEITRIKIGVRTIFGLIFSLCARTAASVAMAVYQRTMKDLAPRGLFRKSLARRNPLRTANHGNIKAPIGKKVSAPVEKAEVRANLKGTKWLPSHIQIAARIGSDVFPLVLPAVDQANSAIKLSGNKVKATLRSAC